jgi:hypothetical protein
MHHCKGFIVESTTATKIITATKISVLLRILLRIVYYDSKRTTKPTAIRREYFTPIILIVLDIFTVVKRITNNAIDNSHKILYHPVII